MTAGDMVRAARSNSHMLGWLRILWRLTYAVPVAIGWWLLYLFFKHGPKVFVYLFKQTAMNGAFFLTSTYALIRLLLNPLMDRSNMNHMIGEVYYPLVSALTGVTVRVEGREHLSGRPLVIMANHQSTLDMLCMTAFTQEHTVAVAKKSLFYVPIFGWTIRLGKNIAVDRGSATAVQSLARASARIQKEGLRVVIFPEGTRSRSDAQLLPFKKGGFHMAIDSKAPIVPVVISSQKKIYDSKAKVFNNGEILVRILPPIETAHLTKDDLPKLMEDVHALMSEQVKLISQ